LFCTRFRNLITFFRAENFSAPILFTVLSTSNSFLSETNFCFFPLNAQKNIHDPFCLLSESDYPAKSSVIAAIACCRVSVVFCSVSSARTHMASKQFMEIFTALLNLISSGWHLPTSPHGAKTQ
jgi:hypothetical protein